MGPARCAATERGRAQNYEYVPGHIFVQHNPGNTLKRLERLDVSAEEALQGLVQGEDRMERPRPAQDQYEGREAPGGVADRDRPEAAPVGLALLAHQQGEPEIRLGRRDRAEGPDHPPQLHDGARVAPLAEHLEQPRGPEPGVALEGLLEERAVGIELARPHDGRPHEALGGQRPADRIGVEAELGGDGPHPPVLGEEEPADLGHLRQGDHGRSSGPPSGGPAGAGPLARSVLGPSGEPPEPAADGTARGPVLEKGLQSSWDIATSWPAVGTLRDGRCRQAREHDATLRGRLGRVMRHAGSTTGAVGPLPVPVIEAPFGALLVPTARGAEAPGAPLPAAG